MKLTTVALSRLKPSTYNPRRISAVRLDAIRSSIDEVGFVQPIVVNKRTAANGWKASESGKRGTFVVIAGHQRLKALKARGDSECDVVVLELDERSEKKANLALQDKGEYDPLALGRVFEDLGADATDLGMTGFGKDDIDRVLKAYARETQPPPEFPKQDDSTPATHTCPRCGYEFNQ